MDADVGTVNVEGIGVETTDDNVGDLLASPDGVVGLPVSGVEAASVASRLEVGDRGGFPEVQASIMSRVAQKNDTLIHFLPE